MDHTGTRCEGSIEAAALRQKYAKLYDLALVLLENLTSWAVEQEEPLATQTALRFGIEADKLAEFMEENAP